jgi:hypothetical protein
MMDSLRSKRSGLALILTVKEMTMLKELGYAVAVYAVALGAYWIFVA